MTEENEQLDRLNDLFAQHPAMDPNHPYSTPNRPGGVLRLPSHRSGFAAHDESASEISSNGPDSPWSPPQPWRPPESSSAWFRHQPYLEESPIPRSAGRGSADIRNGPASRGHSASIFDEDLAANVPLPRGSESPRKEMSPEVQASLAGSRHQSPEQVGARRKEVGEGDPASSDKLANYIRFSLRADVQQRTEPLEQAINWMRNTYAYIMASKARLFTSAVVVLFFAISLRTLFSPPTPAPRPDLIKVATFARSFEPLIHFSEHGVRQLSDLQETGTAVWDLSESVRQANFTSSPIIVSELDALYESLTKLAAELTGFFATVDGDFDNILLVMDWARRELAHLDASPPGTFAGAIGNLHSGLAAVGLLSDKDTEDPRNRIFTSVFGVPSDLRAQQMLQRTFIELLGTLEKSIDEELKHAQALFSLYAAIDRQFLNLQRATMREADVQESLESEVLSSLWQRALGARAAQLKKFEKNKQLLGAVKQRTMFNKNMLVEHNGRLVALKQNLEVLRRRLVSPLLRVDESATASGGMGAGLGLAEQVRQLEETGVHLKEVRQQQKEKVMETLYGAGKRATAKLEIEGM